MKSVIISLLLFLCCFTGCKKSDNKVSLLLDWEPEPEFGGFYAAQANGSFTAHGVNISIKAQGEGDMWQQVATGKTDFATTAADQVLIARARGADVVALFAVYQTSPQGVMVHKARGFKTLEDVFDNPGILEAESNPWLGFCRRKYKNQKVTLSHYSPGIGTFMGKADDSQQCFVTSEPILAAAAHGDPQTFLIADAGYNPYTTVLITRGEMVRTNPSRVKAMVAACREGWRAYLDNPSATNTVMGAMNHEMDAATFTAGAAAQKSLIDAGKAPLGSMTAQRWDELSQQLVEIGVLPVTIPGKNCFVDVDQLP